jgi:lysophospholipase L1-like esterase
MLWNQKPARFFGGEGGQLQIVRYRGVPRPGLGKIDMRRAVAVGAIVAAGVIGGAVYLNFAIPRHAARIEDRLAARLESRVERTVAEQARLLRETNKELEISIARMADEIRFVSSVDSGHRHQEVREFVIRSQLATASEPIVFVGDSITESALLSSLTCKTTVNAGLGGATAGSYLKFARAIFDTQKLGTVVIAIGTNDGQKAARIKNSFRRDYEILIDYFQARSENIILVGVPPLEMSGPLAESYFDADLSARINEESRSVAALRGITFVDLRKAMNGEKLTTDGVHLSTDGYRSWGKAITAKIGNPCSEAKAVLK